MAIVPNVGDNELILTDWGNVVANELNDKAVKNVGAQTMAGPLTVTGAINANGYVVLQDVPTAATHAVRKDYVDGRFVALAGDTMTGLLVINPSASNTCLRLLGDTPLLELLSNSGATRWGYLQGDASLMRVASEGHLVFTAGADRFRLAGSLMLLGKTASNINDAGLELTCAGSSSLGRITSTTAVAGNVGLSVRHMDAADANTELFAIFSRGAANNFCGSIAQGAAANSVFNAGPGGSHTTTSDYRLKNELGPVDDPIGRLKALQPKHLSWRPESGSGGEFDGFIAHEVQEVVPDAVTGDKDAVYPEGHPQAGAIDAQGLDPAKLVPLLTAALQDAVTQIETLTARIDALEAA